MILLSPRRQARKEMLEFCGLSDGLAGKYHSPLAYFASLREIQ
jgi:hypothetical protein